MRRHAPDYYYQPADWPAPDATEPGAAIAQRIAVAGFCWPWLTMLLLAGFVVVFMLEQRLAVTPATGLTPSIPTLLAVGALNRGVVEGGEWFRMLTAPLLHGGVAHLVGNAIAFALAGYALEWLVGRAWMFCLFAIGALAGSALSMAMAAEGVVSVGASGAIMALLAALLMIGLRLPAGRAKTWILIHTARSIVPALIPTGGTGAMRIDYGAHIGGAVAGAVLGFLLWQIWHDDAPLPPFRRAAAACSVMAALAFATSAYAVAQRYPHVPAIASPLAGAFIPAASYPHDGAEALRRAPDLLVAYPRDPRSHYLAALTELQRGDRAEAAYELQAALRLAAQAGPIFRPSFSTDIRILLADTLQRDGRTEEARDAAAPACRASGAAAPSGQLADKLQQSGLCK